MPSATLVDADARAGIGGIDHAARDLVGRLMLPSAKKRPSGTLEGLAGVMIALLILTDLRRPELLVGPGHCVMFRAPVPETPVDDDRELLPGEDDVGPPAQ